MELKLDRKSPTPLHLQIAQRLRELILKGTIPEGGRLPPTRRLARELGVNRSTVVQAYNRLWAEGLIEGHVGRGTVVRRAAGAEEAPVSPLPWRMLLTAQAEAVDLEIQEMMRLFAREDLISLAAGLPAPELYPLEQATEIANQVLAREGDMLLRWCAIEGYPPLRRLLAEQMGLSPSEILITTGSQQGLYLLARALLAPGDFVVVEAPTYLGALQVFRAAGARLIGVPLDGGGMDVEMLENMLARTPPKLIYTLPTFQNPAGATMGLKRRRRLLELAYRYRVPLIEDDPYSLLRYEGEALPPLKTLDTHGYVIYLSTFSKVLFPGLRVGWLAAPQRVIEHLSQMKQMIDMFTNSLAQAVVYQFCQRGFLESHLERVREEYRQRRDIMVEALRHHCPKVEFAEPEGGYFIWCRLERGLTARELLREALRERVSFLTGELFYPDGRGGEEIRLTFTSQPPDAIAEGIKRLGRALRRLKREAVEEATEETSVKPIV